MSNPYDMAYAAGLSEGSQMRDDVVKMMGTENRVLRTWIFVLVIALIASLVLYFDKAAECWSLAHPSSG